MRVSKTLYNIFVSSAKDTASVGIVIGSAFILNYVIIEEGIPIQVASLLEGLDLTPLTFLILMNIFGLLLDPMWIQLMK